MTHEPGSSPPTAAPAGEWPGALSRESLAACAALLVLLLACFHDVVFLGKTLRVSNTVASALPTGHYGASGGVAAFLPVLDNTPALLEEPYLVFKERWLRLPSGSQIAFAPEGAWRFPEGTVFIKHFELALDERSPEQRRRLETRFLVAARNERYYGVTYRWNADESDAEPLLESQEEVLQIIGPDGVAREQAYFYPGPNDCLVCHNADAGYVLGVIGTVILILGVLFFAVLAVVVVVGSVSSTTS